MFTAASMIELFDFVKQIYRCFKLIQLTKTDIILRQ